MSEEEYDHLFGKPVPLWPGSTEPTWLGTRSRQPREKALDSTWKISEVERLINRKVNLSLPLDENLKHPDEHEAIHQQFLKGLGYGPGRLFPPPLNQQPLEGTHSLGNICDEAKHISGEIFREWKTLQRRIQDSAQNGVLTNAITHLFENTSLGARHQFFDKCWKKTQQYFLKTGGETTALSLARVARQDVANMVAEALKISEHELAPYIEGDHIVYAGIDAVNYETAWIDNLRVTADLSNERLSFELFFDFLAPMLCQKNLNDPSMLSAFLFSRATHHPAVFARADFRQLYTGLANRWFSPFACFLGTEMSLDEPSFSTNKATLGQEAWRQEASQMQEHVQTYGKLFDFGAQAWRAHGQAEWAPIGAKYGRLKTTRVTGANDAQRQEFLKTSGEVEKRLNKRLCTDRTREAVSKARSDEAGRTYSFLDGFAVLSAQNLMLHFLNVVCFDAITKWSNHAEQTSYGVPWVTEDLAQYRDLQLREANAMTSEPWTDLGLHLDDQRGISSEQARYQPYVRAHYRDVSNSSIAMPAPELEKRRIESIKTFWNLMRKDSTFISLFQTELDHHFGWIPDAQGQVLQNLQKNADFTQAVVSEATLDIVERVFRRRVLDLEFFHFVQQSYARFVENPDALSHTDWLSLQVHVREFAHYYWHDFARRGIWLAEPRWRHHFRRLGKDKSIANDLPWFRLPKEWNKKNHRSWFTPNSDQASDDSGLGELYNIAGHLMFRFLANEKAASFVGLANILDVLMPLLPRLRHHQLMSEYVSRTVENLNICVQMAKQLDLHRDGERDLRSLLDNGLGNGSGPPRSGLLLKVSTVLHQVFRTREHFTRHQALKALNPLLHGKSPSAKDAARAIKGLRYAFVSRITATAADPENLTDDAPHTKIDPEKEPDSLVGPALLEQWELIVRNRIKEEEEDELSSSSSDSDDDSPSPKVKTPPRPTELRTTTSPAKHPPGWVRRINPNPPRPQPPPELAAPAVDVPVPAEPLPPLGQDIWRIFDSIMGGDQHFSLSDIMQAMGAIGWRVWPGENGQNFNWTPQCRLPAPVDRMALQIHPYKHYKNTVKIQSRKWRRGIRNRFAERGVTQSSLESHYSGCPGWQRREY
ncbi:hypothetical protein ACHAQH_002225 [Verticillium albo-atrum]